MLPRLFGQLPLCCQSDPVPYRAYPARYPSPPFSTWDMAVPVSFLK